jgi:aldose 1-epimerase
MIETTTVDVDGHEVHVLTIANDTCNAVVTDLGARLLELHVPDRDGVLADIVLQRSTFDEIATDDNYMGSTAGRFANRIRGGKLTIDGKPIQLSINEGNNHLHGGTSGFDRKTWNTDQDSQANEVTFRRISPAGEEGYPGNLTMSVTYRLDACSLSIDIAATTDEPTIVNTVHHSYFNLTGHQSGTILDHLLEMRSEYYLPVDDELLPTGEVCTVEGTPFDFRRPTAIGAHIAEVQHSGAGRVTESGVGYDHNFVLTGTGMREVVFVTDPVSGRRMTMSTNQPGVQLYVGGYLEGVTAKAPAGKYPAFAGFTLETQTFPDAPNISHFPSAALRPGENYLNSVRFDFSTAHHRE